MTLLDMLSSVLNGKTVIGGDMPKIIGSTIIRVQMNNYEPMFEIVVLQPNGAIECYDCLAEWNIQVK